jgi:predicted nucleic acid-binding Zn ribbon protein
MPTYEFRLPDGTIIERSYKISEVPSEIPNPNGEGVAVRIISGGAGLVFKGSGFYLTDYGRNAHRTQGDAKPASSAASPSESAPKAKAESLTPYAPRSTVPRRRSAPRRTSRRSWSARGIPPSASGPPTPP